MILPQARVEPDLLDPEVARRQREPAAVLDHDCPTGEPHRGAVEEEVDVAHRHLAVVEIEPAARRSPSAARSCPPGRRPGLRAMRGITSRTLDSARGEIAMRLMSGLPGLDVDRGVDVAGTRRVDDRPGLLPGRLERPAQVVVERQVLGLDLRSILSGGSPLGRSGPGSFWTRPLPVMTAWPFRPRMFLKIQRSGWSSSRPVRLRTG